jgi:hypothetical protein
MQEIAFEKYVDKQIEQRLELYLMKKETSYLEIVPF